MTGDVVEIARSWIGTPYLHQASTKGVGCDCLGLVRGVWRALHGAEPVQVPPYTPDWSEPQRQELLWRAAEQHLIPMDTNSLRPGRVLLFRMRKGGMAKHLGILASAGAMPTFIHAYSGHGVVESPLSKPWRTRVVAQFAFIEGN